MIETGGNARKHEKTRGNRISKYLIHLYCFIYLFHMEKLLTENKITLFQKAYVMVQRIFLTDIYYTSYIYHLLKLI